MWNTDKHDLSCLEADQRKKAAKLFSTFQDVTSKLSCCGSLLQTRISGSCRALWMHSTNTECLLQFDAQLVTESFESLGAARVCQESSLATKEGMPWLHGFPWRSTCLVQVALQQDQ